ncbi:hypothetical protein BGZ90_005290, partial [Linnemannia elongata]
RLEERLPDWEYVLAVKGCLGVISEIVWRPNGLEFATADLSGSTRVWRVVEESSKVGVQMVWGTAGSALVASGSLFGGAIGLSMFNRNLLEQPVVKDENFFSLDDDNFLPSDDNYFLSSDDNNFLSLDDNNFLSPDNEILKASKLKMILAKKRRIKSR